MTPSPLPTKTHEPTPSIWLGVELNLNSDYFTPGSIFHLEATAINWYDPIDCNFFVILDPGIGVYWFWPSWNRWPDKIDYIPLNDFRGTRTEVILDFVWPNVSDSLNGVLFWGALSDPEITEAIGYVDRVEFGYGPQPARSIESEPLGQVNQLSSGK